MLEILRFAAALLALDTEVALDQAIDSLVTGGQLSRDEAGTLESQA